MTVNMQFTDRNTWKSTVHLAALTPTTPECCMMSTRTRTLNSPDSLGPNPGYVSQKYFNEWRDVIHNVCRQFAATRTTLNCQWIWIESCWFSLSCLEIHAHVRPRTLCWIVCGCRLYWGKHLDFPNCTSCPLYQTQYVCFLFFQYQRYGTQTKPRILSVVNHVDKVKHLLDLQCSQVTAVIAHRSLSLSLGLSSSEYSDRARGAWDLDKQGLHWAWQEFWNYSGPLPLVAPDWSSKEGEARQCPVCHVRIFSKLLSHLIKSKNSLNKIKCKICVFSRGIDFDTDTVGLANKFAMCTENSGGVNQVSHIIFDFLYNLLHFL